MAKKIATTSTTTKTKAKSTTQQSITAQPEEPSLVIEPALALFEFSSIAQGVFAADAMVKRATLDAIHAGTVQPGRFLVLLGGEVAEVEEAMKAALENTEGTLIDHIFLPGVHADVVWALAGGRDIQKRDALGIIETYNVPAAIHAADKGVKGADVTLMEVRLADGLGGKGIVFFTGAVSDVEAALEIAESAISTEQLVRKTVIAQLHDDIAAVLRLGTRFGDHLRWTSG